MLSKIYRRKIKDFKFIIMERICLVGNGLVAVDEE